MTPDRLQKAFRALSAGRPEETLKLLAGGPPAVPVLLLRGGALASLGQNAEAAKLFEKVLKKEPGQLDAAYNLAICQQALGRFHAARKNLELVLKKRPGNTDAMLTLSSVLAEVGRPEEREALLKSAVAAQPNDPRFRHNLAFLYFQTVRYEDAAEILESLLGEQPRSDSSINLLGRVRLAQGKKQANRERIEQAVTLFEQAMLLNPSSLEHAVHFGDALNALKDTERAIKHHEALVARHPDDTRVHHGLGVALLNNGQLRAASESFERAVACNESNAQSQYQLAVTALALGDFEAGSQRLEWRWRIRDAPNWRSRDLPLWDGRTLEQGRLLVWSEQGLGDEVLHYGWLAGLTARGIEFGVECEPRLVSLMERSFPMARVFPAEDLRLSDLANSDFAVQCPSADLLLRTRPWETPKNAPGRYLESDREKCALFTRRLAEVHAGRKIGTSWVSKGSGFGFGKSVPLKNWGAILSERDALFVNLQYGDSEQEFVEACMASGAQGYCDPELDRKADIDGLCALIDSLDLVITVSNVTAHFAGALGKPCWVLLGPDPLWHWGAAGQKAPFYPTVTTLRHSELGGWEGVLAEAARRLDDFLG